MSDLKTTPTVVDVNQFLNKVEPKKRQQDAFEILELMQSLTGEPPVMWGTAIIGFGQYHYKYASGREGDWMQIGFSPRKTALTLYIMSGFKEYGSLMEKLGKYKTGKSCLYINKLEDVDKKVLTQLIKKSLKYMKDKYPE